MFDPLPDFLYLRALVGALGFGTPALARAIQGLHDAGWYWNQSFGHFTRPRPWVMVSTTA